MSQNHMKLREFFPSTTAGAAIYGGFMSDKWHFCKVFKIHNTPEETITEINQFLHENDYETFTYDDLDETYTYELEGL